MCERRVRSRRRRGGRSFASCHPMLELQALLLQRLQLLGERRECLQCLYHFEGSLQRDGGGGGVGGERRDGRIVVRGGGVGVERSCTRVRGGGRGERRVCPLTCQRASGGQWRSEGGTRSYQ